MSADLSKYFEVLRRYDTPTVCNAIEVFDIRPRNEGWMDQRIKSLFPKMPPIVGYATTATFRSGEPAEESDVYSAIAKQGESFVENVPTPRIVVFQDLDDPIRGATFGEVMCSTYQAFGCVGLITSGAARDLDQVERIGFSCFASGVSPSHSYCRVLEVDQSVKVGGVEVHPGDVIHADCNGVTTIPKELVPEIALGCEKLVEAENVVIDYVRQAKPLNAKDFAAAQAKCAGLFAEIPDAVRRQLSEESE